MTASLRRLRIGQKILELLRLHGGHAIHQLRRTGQLVSGEDVTAAVRGGDVLVGQHHRVKRIHPVGFGTLGPGLAGEIGQDPRGLTRVLRQRRAARPGQR
jgi:hypothetical protein